MVPFRGGHWRAGPRYCGIRVVDWFGGAQIFGERLRRGIRAGCGDGFRATRCARAGVAGPARRIEHFRAGAVPAGPDSESRWGARRATVPIGATPLPDRSNSRAGEPRARAGRPGDSAARADRAAAATASAVRRAADRTGRGVPGLERHGRRARSRIRSRTFHPRLGRRSRSHHGRKPAPDSSPVCWPISTCRPMKSPRLPVRSSRGCSTN